MRRSRGGLLCGLALGRLLRGHALGPARTKRAAWIAAALPALVLVAFAGSSRAADLNVSATVDRNVVAIDEQVILTVMVSGGLQSLPAPDVPDLPGFSVYSAGSSRNFSLVNGKLSSSASFRFVLSPRNIGTFTIPAIEVRSGNQSFRTTPIEVRVVSASARPQGGPPPPSGEPRPRSGGKDLFLRAAVDKREAFVNQQVTLTVRFYQRVQLLESPQYTPAPATGFWVEDLPPQRNYYDTVDGQEYYVTEIRTALFPTAPGELTIGPATLLCQVRDEDDFFGRGGDPFQFFGHAFGGGRQVSLRSEPITVRALPMPAGGPPDFSGAVGKFNLQVSADRTETSQNEPVTLTVTLSGEGNLQGLPSIAVPEIPGVRSYDSGSSTDMSKEDYRVHGTRTETKILVPEAAGSFTIPPLKLVYFDTQAQRYLEASSQPIAVRVKGGAGGSSGGAARQGISLTGRDVRYIELRPPSLRRTGDRWGFSAGAWALQFVPLAALAAAYVLRRHRERLGADEAYARERRAPREVRRRLEAARASFAAGDLRGVYGEIAHAVLGFVADRMNLPPSALTVSSLAETLERSGAEGSVVADVRDLLGRCDLARFSPAVPERAQAEADLTRAESLLRRLTRVRLRQPQGAAR